MTQDFNESPEPLLIDARGLNCPLPVLKLSKALEGLPSGTVVELLATDRTTLRDVPTFCDARGYDNQATEASGYLRFRVRCS